MKNLLIIIALGLLVTPLLGQLEKGDWSIGTTNSLTFTKNNFFNFIPNSNFYVSEDVGLMVSKRSMIGLGLSFSKTYYPFNASDERSTSSSKTMSPFYRYYIKKDGASLFFSEFSVNFRRERFKDGSFSRLNTGSKINIGAGFQHFIAPNIALEGVLGTKIYSNGTASLDPANKENLYFNIGIKTFINKRFDEKINLLDRYLKQGNYSISGNGFIHLSYANVINLFFERNSLNFAPRRGVYFGITPRIQYFKTDHWLVGGGADFSLLITGAGHRIAAGISMNTGYYIPLKKKLFLLPSIGLSYKRTVVNADMFLGSLIGGLFTRVRTHESAQSITIPFSLAFKYFTDKNIIFSSGLDLNTSYRESKSFRNQTSTLGKVFLGLEYFFAPNLSIDVNLNKTIHFKDSQASIDGIDLIELPNELRFSLGLSYFVFK